MSVTLRKKLNKDGSTSLYLDIYNEATKERKREFLTHLKLSKAVNATDRALNKHLFQQAKEIQIERAKQLQANDYDLQSDAGKHTDVASWMDAYCKKYKKADIRNMVAVVAKFKTFLSTELEKTGITFKQLNKEHLQHFNDYLNETCSFSGGASYFTRFKKMIKAAYEAGLLNRNIAAEVRTDAKAAKKKDVLTLDEIKLIAATNTESPTVKNAFLFSCVTGLRFSDVKALTWKDIDLASKMLQIQQLKTRKDTTIPLNTSAIALLGEPGKPNQHVFDLPSANGSNKTIKAIVKRAGITKAITWHNARHSFGTNLILNEVNVVTASRLLGHTSLAHTQRYVNTADQLKRKATDAIDINL